MIQAPRSGVSGLSRGRPGRLPRPVLVGGLCLGLAAVLNAVLLHEHGLSGDEPYYDRMASHPAGAHNFPYAFRVGLPHLVHLSPFSSGPSWLLLALLADAAAAAALFALLREFDIQARLSVGLAVGFALSPPLLVVLLRNGRGVDAAAILVITLGCLFIVRHERVALAATLLVAVTIHESCLFLIPLAYAVWARRPLDPRALRDLVMVAALPAILYVWLRSSIVAVGQRYQPGYTGAFFSARLDVITAALRHGGWRTELRRLAIDFGPLWLAAPFALPSLRFSRRGLVLVPLAMLSFSYALDWGRIAFFAAPVVYVSAAHVLSTHRRLAVAAIIGLLALDFGYAGYMQLHGVRYGLDTTGPPARGPVR